MRTWKFPARYLPVYQFKFAHSNTQHCGMYKPNLSYAAHIIMLSLFKWDYFESLFITVHSSLLIKCIVYVCIRD